MLLVPVVLPRLDCLSSRLVILRLAPAPSVAALRQDQELPISRIADYLTYDPAVATAEIPFRDWLNGL